MDLTNLTILADNVAYILILGGAIAASWLLERTVKPLSWIVKIASLFGFIVGILLMITAAVVWPSPAHEYTRYLLIATGLALVLKPIKDIPWAALIAMLVGGVCAGYVFLYFPPLPETVLGISSTWIYLIIFFIPALLVYMMFKFIEDALRLIGMILASGPVAIILGLICIVQGVLLLLDKNLFTIILG